MKGIKSDDWHSNKYQTQNLVKVDRVSQGRNPVVMIIIIIITILIIITKLAWSAKCYCKFYSGAKMA